MCISAVSIVYAGCLTAPGPRHARCARCRLESLPTQPNSTLRSDPTAPSRRAARRSCRRSCCPGRGRGAGRYGRPLLSQTANTRAWACPHHYAGWRAAWCDCLADAPHHTTPHHTTLPPTLCFAWTSLFTTGLYPHYLSTAAKEPHGELPSRMLQLAVGLGGLVGWVGLCLGARRMCGLAGERADAVCQVTMLIGCGMWIFIGAQIVHHIIMGVYIM
jgi:hypothetical protein